MPDLSQIMQMMNEMKSQMPSDSSSQASNSSHLEDSVPDIETMMKLTKILGAMNSSQNNASTNLLYALKPFLRESKKEKIDQCANILKMSSVIDEINKSGGI